MVSSKNFSSVPRSPEFACRFRQACDDSPHVPAKHDGRYVYIIREFLRLTGETISTETVRKWHEGEASPRPAKISVLAEILGVDPVWLQMGRSTGSKSPFARLNNQQSVDSDWDGVIKVPIRAGRVVRMENIPGDLSRAEAQRIANVILAHAVLD